MKKLIIAFLAIAMVFGASNAFAGTQKGDLEVGIQFDYMNVSVDNFDIDTIIIAGKVGWFMRDELSLGVSVSGMTIDFDDGDATQLTFEFEPNYHFNPSADVIPYAGIHTGFAVIEQGNNDDTQLSYGPQAGIKAFLSESTAIDTQLRYTFTEIDDVDVDIFELRVGLNIYF